MQMLQQISSSTDDESADLCRRILQAVTSAQRPPWLSELEVLAELPEDIRRDIQSIRDLVSHCGSFLTIRDDVAYFVHQSAQRRTLEPGKAPSIFGKGPLENHRAISGRCRGLMGRVLKQDVCGLGMPGILVNEIDPRQIKRCLPAAVQYACSYWISHLLLANSPDSGTLNGEDSRDVYDVVVHSPTGSRASVYSGI